MRQAKATIAPFFEILLLIALLSFSGNISAAICIGANCSYTTIQNAINAATSGQTITVDAGTYSENITFALAADNITLKGAGAATTKIQGVSGVDTRVVIFSSSTTTAATVLDGFTIDNQHYYDHTGGILITGGASPTLRNLKVSGNSLRNSGANHYGGGIKIVDSGATIIDSVIGGVGGGNWGDMGGGGIYATSTDASKKVVIINTEISYNSTGGGGGGISARSYAGTVTITDSLINYNTNTTSSGGGAVCRTCALMEFINTDVDNNSNTAAYSTNRGGGIAVADGGLVTFTNGSISGNYSNRASGGINVQGAGSTFTANRCKISGNQAGSGDSGGGLSVLEGASTTLTNCMITGNKTGTNWWSSGGGVFVGNGGAVIDHSTISGNWSNKTGGGVHSGDLGTTTITNSLLWGNTSKDAGTWDLFHSGGPITTVHYSAVGSGKNYAGSNNITAITGTVFVAPDPATGATAPKTTGDYHLKSDAVEAINTADPLSTVTEDFDGEFRPTAGRNDMGADEIDSYITCNYELTPFLCFNAYSLGDYSMTGNIIGGAIGVAGNYTSKSYTLSNEDGFEYVLLVNGLATIGSGQISADRSGGKLDVGGNITFEGGGGIHNDVHSGGNVTAASGWTAVDGDIFAAGTISLDGTGSGTVSGTEYPGTPYTSHVDHSAISSYFSDVSISVGSLEDTVATTPLYGALNVTAITGNNVTSVDADTLRTSHTFNITGPSDAVLYINVVGTSGPTLDGTTWNYNGGITKEDVLLNFPSATTLNLTGTNIVNMLAPKAIINAPSGSVTGNFIGGQIGSDITVNLGHFRHAPPTGGGPTTDHFAVTYDDAGINCVGESVTVRPQDSSNADILNYANTIWLKTATGKGDWSASTNATGVFSNGAAGDGLASYTFNGTETLPVTFLLDYPEVATFDIEVWEDGDTSINDGAVQNITFSPTGFTVTRQALTNPVTGTNYPVQTQTAGTPFNLHIAAYGQTASDPECGIIEGYAGNKTLRFWSDFVNPGPVGRPKQVTVSNTPIAQSETDTATFVGVSFFSGQAVVSVNYLDVGSMYIRLRDETITSSEIPTGIYGSTNEFVVAPADFVLPNITAGECGGGGTSIVLAAPFDHTNGNTIPAGSDFCVKVKAVAANGVATPSFGQETPAESVSLISTIVAPAIADGGYDPGIVTPNLSFVDGEAEALFNWAEVGITNLTAHVKDGNYLGAGDITSSESVPVGRFTPARFSVVPQDPVFKPGCPLGQFTYIGEGFNYSEIPSLVLTAYNSLDNPTINYTLPGWDKLTATNAAYSSTVALNNTTPVLTQTREDGVITIVFDAANAPGLQSFTRTIAPQSDFTAQIALSIDLHDGDDVPIDGGPIGGTEYEFIFGGTVAPNGISFGGTEDDKRVFYGALEINDNGGSVALDLKMPVEVQRYSNINGFVPNEDDVCTGGVGNASDITFSLIDANGADALAPANTCILENPSVDNESDIACAGVEATADRTYAEPPLNSGDFNVWLRAPDYGASGELFLEANVPTWLRLDRNSDGVGDNPQGHARFGVFTGNKQHIFLREVY